MAVGAFLTLLLSGGLYQPPLYAEFQRPPPYYYAAEPRARPAEFETRPPPPQPERPSAPPPEPESSGASASVIGAAAAAGVAGLSEGGRRIVRRRLRGKQEPRTREVSVQTSPFELSEPTLTASTPSTGTASVTSSPARVSKKYGRRA